MVLNLWSQSSEAITTGQWLEMHIIRFTPDLLNQELWGWRPALSSLAVFTGLWDSHVLWGSLQLLTRVLWRPLHILLDPVLSIFRHLGFFFFLFNIILLCKTYFHSQNYKTRYIQSPLAFHPFHPVPSYKVPFLRISF